MEADVRKSMSDREQIEELNYYSAKHDDIIVKE